MTERRRGGSSTDRTGPDGAPRLRRVGDRLCGRRPVPDLRSARGVAGPGVRALRRASRPDRDRADLPLLAVRPHGRRPLAASGEEPRRRRVDDGGRARHRRAGRLRDRAPADAAPLRRRRRVARDPDVPGVRDRSVGRHPLRAPRAHRHLCGPRARPPHRRPPVRRLDPGRSVRRGAPRRGGRGRHRRRVAPRDARPRRPPDDRARAGGRRPLRVAVLLERVPLCAAPHHLPEHAAAPRVPGDRPRYASADGRRRHRPGPAHPGRRGRAPASPSPGALAGAIRG